MWWCCARAADLFVYGYSLTHSYMPDDIVGRALYSALPTKRNQRILKSHYFYVSHDEFLTPLKMKSVDMLPKIYEHGFGFRCVDVNSVIHNCE